MNNLKLQQAAEIREQGSNPPPLPHTLPQSISPPSSLWSSKASSSNARWPPRSRAWWVIEPVVWGEDEDGGGSCSYRLLLRTPFKLFKFRQNLGLIPPVCRRPTLRKQNSGRPLHQRDALKVARRCSVTFGVGSWFRRNFPTVSHRGKILNNTNYNHFTIKCLKSGCFMSIYLWDKKK